MFDEAQLGELSWILPAGSQGAGVRLCSEITSRARFSQKFLGPSWCWCKVLVGEPCSAVFTHKNLGAGAGSGCVPRVVCCTLHPREELEDRGAESSC